MNCWIISNLKTVHVNSDITRRQFLKATGALVVAFGLPVELQAQSAPALRTSGGPLAAEPTRFLANGSARWNG